MSILKQIHKQMIRIEYCLKRLMIHCKKLQSFKMTLDIIIIDQMMGEYMLKDLTWFDVVSTTWEVLIW